LKLHEYQARDLLAANGVATTAGRVASTPAEARAIAHELGGKVVVKAQIHAGGRGKGRLVAESETADMFKKLTSDADNYSGKVKGDRVGGVRLADTVDEAEQAASAILGKHLVSIQTGPEGKLVKNVLVAEQTDIAKEYYLAAIVDGMAGGALIMASAEGGQEIEVVAHNNPEAIVRVAVNPAAGYETYVGRTLAAPRPYRRPGRSVREDRAGAVQDARRHRRQPRRNQPARGHRRWPRGRRRCQAEHRRQRALPAQGPRSPAR